MFSSKYVLGDTMGSLSRKMEISLFAFITVFLVIKGFLSGTNPVNYLISLDFLSISITVLDALSRVSFLTFSLTLSALLLFKIVSSNKEIPEKVNGDQVEAVIPVYNDHEILGRAVESLRESNYKNLNINIICEPEDIESQEKAKKLGCNLILNDHPGSKPGAINTAFETLESDYFAIFDADEVISQDFIPNAMGYLNQGYEGFQGRRVDTGKGIVEKFSYCERALFQAATLISQYTSFPYIKASSTVVKRCAWEKAGGYDDMIAEDIDFAHKCFRNGVKVKSDRRCTNKLEAPHSAKDFWGQRKRWAMGAAQILFKCLKRDYKTEIPHRGFLSTFKAIIVVLIPLSLIGLTSKIAILVLLGLEPFYLAPVLSAALPPLFLSYHDRKTLEVDFIGLYAFMSFLVLPLSGLITLKANIEYLMSWDGGWYRVEKQG